jgi:hypothetical protein
LVIGVLSGGVYFDYGVLEGGDPRDRDGGLHTVADVPAAAGAVP